MNQQLIDLVKTAAEAVQVDPALACAVVEQESAWITWAIRYEPAFLNKYVPADLSPTERTARSTSWGLMQIMGQVAREEGYGGFLPALCDPLTGVTAGLKHLKRCLGRTGTVEEALLMWNGGGNKQYPAEVMARMKNY